MTSYNKYRNVKTVVDGITFHSKVEAKRYGELKLLQMAGEISGLQLQPSIDLVCNSKKIGRYVGDFFYYDKATKKMVLEDVKSEATMTPIYKLKKKILSTYEPPIEIVEIMR
jgi:hypothetical protein